MVLIWRERHPNDLDKTGSHHLDGMRPVCQVFLDFLRLRREISMLQPGRRGTPASPRRVQHSESGARSSRSGLSLRHARAERHVVTIGGPVSSPVAHRNRALGLRGRAEPGTSRESSQPQGSRPRGSAPVEGEAHQWVASCPLDASRRHSAPNLNLVPRARIACASRSTSKRVSGNGE